MKKEKVCDCGLPFEFVCRSQFCHCRKGHVVTADVLGKFLYGGYIPEFTKLVLMCDCNDECSKCSVERVPIRPEIFDGSIAVPTTTE
jgi:hypothetical protein